MREDTPTVVDGVSRDELFDVLGHRFRRSLLICLRRHAVTISLADAAEEVVCLTRGEPITEIDAEYVKEVYLSLYHSHVPRLVEYDIVRYEQERDLVTPTAKVDPIGAYLEHLSAY